MSPSPHPPYPVFPQPVVPKARKIAPRLTTGERIAFREQGSIPTPPMRQNGPGKTTDKPALVCKVLPAPQPVPNLQPVSQPQQVPTEKVGNMPNNGQNSAAAVLGEQYMRDAQERLWQSISGHISSFVSDVTKYARKRLREEAERQLSDNQPPDPQNNLSASWATGRPLSLKLSKTEVGDPDERLKKKRCLRMRRPRKACPLKEEPLRTQHLQTPTAIPQPPSEVATHQKEARLDNPTSFYKAFRASGFRLWPSISLIQARDRDFLSSCTDKTTLKLMSRYLTEHALDQLSRCDSSCDLESNWVLTKKNIYLKLSRHALRNEELQKGEMCSCILEKEGTTSGKTGIACSDERCENRAMNIECVPGQCGGRESCKNLRLQKQEFPKVEVRKVQGKGYGLMALETIHPGTMVAEYLGEVMNKQIFAKRLMRYQGERHFYFMILNSKLFIDASRRAGIARFINHSCDPNCIAEKWNAGGEPHVAIVAEREIKPMEEITFPYQAQPLGSRRTRCLCGATNCQGWLTPLPVSGMEGREMGSDDGEVVAASKIRQAHSDLALAEEILQKIYGIREM